VDGKGASWLVEVEVEVHVDEIMIKSRIPNPS
jgi:hypothetical protein